MNAVWTCLFLSLATVLHAVSPDQAVELPNPPRILDLIPNLVAPFTIEPAIPSNFVAMSHDGTLDPCDWIYWGPEDVLKAYFKNSKQLKSGVIRVKLSGNTAQTRMGQFGEEAAQIVTMIKRQDPKGAQHKQLQWGDYPVIAVKAKMFNQTMLTAWAGLNDPETGLMLMFNLVYADLEKGPNEQELALWDNFIQNTRQLTGHDYIRATGQDLQPGYTVARVGRGKFKITAEERERDGQIQIVVVPISPNIHFDANKLETCRLGTEWNCGAPLVKVYGLVIHQMGNSADITNYVASILPETVQEFSVKPEEAKAKGYALYVF